MYGQRRIAALAFIPFYWLAVPAGSQVFTGAILGTVHDPTGAPIVGASVTVSSVDTGYHRMEKSNGSGDYVFNSLQPGNYQIGAEAAGFKQEVVSGVVLGANLKVQVNIDLKLGQMAEKVEITGTAALVDTADHSVSQVIDQKKIVDLPLNGRNFVQLAQLTTGVEERSIARGLMSVNGTRGNSSGFLFDGVDANDANAIFLSLTPSIDAIEEFNIQTSNYSAEFGHSAGGQVNLVSKSGTNRLHGSAFEFIRNSELDARDFFAPANQPIPPYKRNQFGTVVSGPIVRNRTFFMLNYEGSRIRQSITLLAAVPTLAQRSGDFSQTFNATTGALIPVKDPSTGQPFPGNLIPATRIDPTGSKILALYPAPNRAGTQNYVSSLSDSTDANLGAARIDHRISDKDTFFGRYFISDSHEYNPFGQVSGAGGTTVPGFPVLIPATGQNISLNWTRVVNPRTVMESRFGYMRYYTGRTEDTSRDGLSLLGIQGANAPANAHGYPSFTIPGYATLGDRTELPQIRPQNTFHYFWNLSRISGKHSLKMGFEARRIQENLTLSNNIRGLFTFSSTYTGFALGDVLLGLPLSASKLTTTLIAGMRQTNAGTYFQDDWKVSRRLTLNLGVRYEYFSPVIDKYDNARLFDPTDDTIRRVGTGSLPRSGYNPDKNNLAPRVGFALSPFNDNKTVVRGGYGVFYDYENFNTFLVTMLAPSLSYNNPGTIAGALISTAAAQPPAPNAIQRNFRTAYYQEWNLMVERSLPGNTLASLGYVGTKGTDIPIALDSNQPLLGPGTPQAKRPLPQFGGINLLASSQSSTYHALQARLEKRFSHGVTFLTNYTFSKAIDAGVQDQSATQNAYNTRADRGLASLDSPHKFNASFLYELPFGKGRQYLSTMPRAGQAVIGGWQVNGIFSLLSGQPINPVTTADIANIGRNGQRPDRIASGVLSNPTPDRWYSPAAFVHPAAGTFGNSGRDILLGPGIRNADLSLFKEFGIMEKIKLQFRTEFFNAFNTPHFGAPNAQTDTNAAGTISATSQANRQIQFALKLLF